MGLCTLLGLTYVSHRNTALENCLRTSEETFFMFPLCKIKKHFMWLWLYLQNTFNIYFHHVFSMDTCKEQRGYHHYTCITWKHFRHPYIVLLLAVSIPWENAAMSSGRWVWVGTCHHMVVGIPGITPRGYMHHLPIGYIIQWISTERWKMYQSIIYGHRLPGALFSKRNTEYISRICGTIYVIVCLCFTDSMQEKFR
jgi:hypothetical protein